MPATNPPADPAQQVQWLVDRAALQDLVASFGVAVDDKDKAGYAANFTEDGVVELPFGRIEGRAAIAEMKGPPPQWKTHHQYGSMLFDLDGDSASVRAYTTATHVFDPVDKTKKAHSGGWYEFAAVRTDEGWRLRAAKLVIIWEDERPMIPGMPPHPGAGGPPPAP